MTPAPLSSIPLRGQYDPVADKHRKASGPGAPQNHAPGSLRDPDFYKVFSPDGAEVYIGHLVDCREMMELHGFTNEPPAAQVGEGQ